MKTKSKKTIKAWLCFWEGEKNPDVYFRKPAKNEIKRVREWGYKIVPCEIIYEVEK